MKSHGVLIYKYQVNWMLCSRYHLGSYFYSGFCSHLQSKHAHSQWKPSSHLRELHFRPKRKKIHRLGFLVKPSLHNVSLTIFFVKPQKFYQNGEEKLGLHKVFISITHCEEMCKNVADIANIRNDYSDTLDH